MYNWDNEKLSQDIWWLVKQAHDAMHKAADVYFARHQYSQEEITILSFFIQQPDGITLDDFSKWAFRNKNGVARIINNMEKEGFIAKNEQSRRRQFVYHITEKGEKLLREYLPLGVELAELVTKHFSDDELLQFKDYLKKTRDIYLAQLGIQASSPRESTRNTLTD